MGNHIELRFQNSNKYIVGRAESNTSAVESESQEAVQYLMSKTDSDIESHPQQRDLRSRRRRVGEKPTNRKLQCSDSALEPQPQGSGQWMALANNPPTRCYLATLNARCERESFFFGHRECSTMPFEF